MSGGGAELVAFVRARLDDDAQAARAVPGDLRQPWSDPGPWIMAGSGGGGGEAEIVKVPDGVPMPIAEALAAHIARHDPARVLADIDAKRQVLAGYTKAVEKIGELAALRERLKASGQDVFMTEMEKASAIHKRDVLHGVLQLLALPYASHPDYDPRWTPEEARR